VPACAIAFDHLRRDVDPLLGSVDVGDRHVLVTARHVVPVHPCLVEVGVRDTPACLAQRDLVLVDQRVESLADLVDGDVELVGELVVYLYRFGMQIGLCHRVLTVSALFSVGDIRLLVPDGLKM
jgi:hypothetical protein